MSNVTPFKPKKKYRGEISMYCYATIHVNATSEEDAKFQITKEIGNLGMHAFESGDMDIRVSMVGEDDE